jgi:hypothetical protein
MRETLYLILENRILRLQRLILIAKNSHPVSKIGVLRQTLNDVVNNSQVWMLLSDVGLRSWWRIISLLDSLSRPRTLWSTLLLYGQNRLYGQSQVGFENESETHVDVVIRMRPEAEQK